MSGWLERAAAAVVLLTVMLAPALPVAATEAEERTAEYYEEGRNHLDDADWSRAVRSFDKVLALGGSKAPGAYYWKAYALAKQGRPQDALSVLGELEHTHPDSRWSRDARALQVELRGSAGKPVSPESESDEELKLIALSSLMHMEPERALPMLEKILAGNSSPRMKEQALFVLVQTGSPRAREILMEIASGRSSPDLQYVALEHMGMFGEAQDRSFLDEIWKSTDDRRAKRAILQSYMMAEDSARLMEIARNEPDDELRREALQYLGHAGAEDELLRMYENTSSVEDRTYILEGLAMSGNVEKLMEVGRNEKHPELRRVAIRSLGMVDDPRAAAFLEETYAKEVDLDVKLAVLEAMMWHDNVDLLIRIARTEKDLELKRHAVEALAMSGSPRATEFLLEILDE